MRVCLVVFRSKLFFYFVLFKKKEEEKKKWSSDEFGNNGSHQQACVPQSGPQNCLPARTGIKKPLTAPLKGTQIGRETDSFKCFMKLFPCWMSEATSFHRSRPSMIGELSGF